MTADDVNRQREKVHQSVIDLWREMHALGTDNLTWADIELWSALTRHTAIAAQLNQEAEGYAAQFEQLLLNFSRLLDDLLDDLRSRLAKSEIE